MDTKKRNDGSYTNTYVGTLMVLLAIGVLTYLFLPAFIELAYDVSGLLINK